MGGGGDNYEAQAAAQEAKKQRARNALNLVFGVAPTPIEAPLSRFSDMVPGFNEAKADANVANVAEADKNKLGRETLYQSIRDNAFTAGRRGLDENQERASRDNRFALFAQGLNGGSVDIDENALLKRTADRGLLDLGAKADATKADIMGNDEQTRLGLLQSIDAGMDQGSALSSALNQMRVNSDRAAAAAQGTSIGDLFADSGLLYTKSKEARGRQAAQDWWQTNYPRPGMGSGGGGIISATGG